MMTIMRNIMLAPYVVFAAALVGYVFACRLRVRAQAIWTMLLIVCCAKFHVFRYLCGSAFNPPELPATLILAWGWAFAFAAFLGIVSLPLVWWRSRLKAVALTVVAAAIAGVGLWNSVKMPEVHEVTLAYPDLPRSLEGYRIAVVTDIHCSSSARRERTRNLVNLVNSVNADLICLLGDNVDGLPDRRARDLEPIRDLRAKDGVWAVTGNHEYYHDYFGWEDVYARLGLRFLTNECVFPRKGLALGGVPDLAASRRHLSLPNVQRAFAAATNGEFRVLMQHQPRMAHANVVGHHVDLQLSGHTHGGFMPVFSEIVRRHNQGFLSGLYPIEKGWLLVSNGVGQWAGFPMRLFTPSEIVVVVLKKGTEK